MICPNPSDHEALTLILAVVCDCGPAWTGRGRHAPDCFYAEVRAYVRDEPEETEE